MEKNMIERLTQAAVNNLPPKTKAYDVRDSELKDFQVRVNPSGSASYVLGYRNKAGQSRRYTIGKVGQITTKQARLIAQKKKLEIANGQDPNEEKRLAREESERHKKSTFKAFFENRYKQYLETHHKASSGSIARLRKFVERWGDKPLSEINLKLLNDYITERKNNNIASSTINRELNIVRGMFRVAVEENVIQYNPFIKLRDLKTDRNPKPRYLKDEEEIRLINQLKKRQQEIFQNRENGNEWRRERNYELMHDFSNYEYVNYLLPLVLIALKTGMRRMELLSLKWQNVHLEVENLYIQIQGEDAKSSQSRSIPLNKEAVVILNEWKRFCNDSPIESELVFPNPVSGQQMTEIGSAWNRALEKAKIHDFRFHDLRHTFASKLAMKGVDLYSISKLLGHADITMTLRYAHLSPGHLRSAIEGI